MQDFLRKDHRDQFEGRSTFTISLRTGIYRDAKSISQNLYFITQSLYHQIRMQLVELDIEGIKKILKVEIERSVKHSQHIKLSLI